MAHRLLPPATVAVSIVFSLSILLVPLLFLTWREARAAVQMIQACDRAGGATVIPRGKAPECVFKVKA